MTPLLFAAAAALTVPTVTSVTVEAPGGDAAAIEARLAPLIGQRAKPALIAGALRQVEDILPGGASVDIRGGALHVRSDGQRRRLGRLAVVMGDRVPDDEGSWRLLRQIETYAQPLTLAEGRRFHPFLLEVDEQIVRHYFVGRGYLDARVEPHLVEDEALVSVVLRMRAGPRYRIGKVDIEGFPVSEDMRDSLYWPGDRRRPAPWRIEADAERLRAHVCRAGHPDATIDVRQVRDGAALALTFVVRPGPAVKVSGFQIVGRELPNRVVHGLPLRDGAPFCSDLLRETEARIIDHLRDNGHPDGRVEATARNDGGGARVTVRVRAKAAVRVTRIWFEGQTVSRRRILELLIEVQPGDVFRQSAIDASLQTLLRSGLFKSANARVEPGGGAGERYLTFVLVERDFVSIDVVERSMTLHNIDVSHVAAEVDLLSRGAYLRGSGQSLKVHAQTTRQGFRFNDRFSNRHLVSRLAANRREVEFGTGLGEIYYDGEVGIGVEALAHRARLLPVFLYEWSDVTGEGFDGVASGSVVNTAIGAEAGIDVSELDAERVRYLGLELSARYLYGTSRLGGDATLHRLRTKLAAHLPLGTTRDGQHFVLRLRGAYAILEPVEGDPAPHLRPRPTIRGYGNLVLRHTLAEGTLDEVSIEIGAREVTEVTIEIRIPLPFRRHAVSPFLDAATMADDGDSNLSNGRASTGAAYHFSFFDERLEGFVYAAYPLVDEVDLEYFGFGVDGSF